MGDHPGLSKKSSPHTQTCINQPFTPLTNKKSCQAQKKIVIDG